MENTNTSTFTEEQFEATYKRLKRLITGAPALAEHEKWLLMHVNEYPDLATVFENFPVDLVFGHFGYSHTKHGIDDKGFHGLLELMRNGQAWVKMTGPYRICDGDLPYADMRPWNDAVIDANPKRLIWGSDWPHVMVKKQMPHDADLCDLLGAWVNDESLRKTILVDNPCILYDFPAFK